MFRKAVDAVREFHETFGCHIGDKPEFPDMETRHVRLNLLEEEINELHHAEFNNDLVETADAIGDCIYILIGTAISYGIDINGVFDAIHRNNMTKVWPDGTVHLSKEKGKEGKILKPPNFEKVDLKSIIYKK